MLLSDKVELCFQVWTASFVIENVCLIPNIVNEFNISILLSVLGLEFQIFTHFPAFS